MADQHWIVLALAAGAAWLLGEKTSAGVRGALASGGTIKVRLTTYYPYKTYGSAAEARLEGGPRDKRSQPLNTLEMYQRGEAPWVSVSGDDRAWPYGQLIYIDAWPGVPFRVVDTGANFSDAAWALKVGGGKVYKAAGYEPLDIATDYPPQAHPTKATATIVVGDALASGEVRADYFEGQEVQW